MFSNVVFPDPEGPKITIKSPFSNFKSIPFKTGVSTSPVIYDFLALTNSITYLLVSALLFVVEIISPFKIRFEYNLVCFFCSFNFCLNSLTAV